MEFRNDRKIKKIMISPYLPMFPWQRQMHNQNFKHVFMHNGVMSLYCELNSMTIKSLKCSELFRPNIGLIDPSSFAGSNIQDEGKYYSRSTP